MNVFIVILLIFFSVCANASKVPVALIIDLDRRLSVLKSEIFIAGEDLSENYENSSLYHIKNKSWIKSLESITSDDIDDSTEYKNYKRILYGISLQGIGNNRQALNHYNKVSSNSIHYATAQLNIALLHFHDGHINKAFNKLDKLYSGSSVNLNARLKNRILLILGYLYLKSDKFNEARKIFRKIPVGSTYFNSAIIGTAQAATKSQDFSASENVLLYLQKNRTYDLAVDESYILLAYTYEAQMEFGKAARAYEKAIAYYSERLKNIDRLLYENVPLKIDEVFKKHIFVVSGNKIDLLGRLPYSFFNNYSQSKQLLIQISDLVGEKNKMHQRATDLFAEYRDIIKPLLLDELMIRKNILLDYINQSRYRLATTNDRASALK